MTVNRTLAIILGVATLFAVYLWWPSDESAIKRRWTELGAVLSVPSREQDLNRVARLAGIRGYLAEDIHLRVADQDLTPRDAVMALAAQWSRSEAASVTFSVDQLTFDSNGTARMHVTMTVTPIDGRPGDGDIRTADVEMAKRNGEWVITNAVSKEASTRQN